MNSILTHIQNQVLIKPTQILDEITQATTPHNHRLEYYKITEYINNFLNGENVNRYFILPGIRSVGKSNSLSNI